MATLSAEALSGLRVLVTRPSERAAELITALQGAGAQALHLPALEIAPLDNDKHASALLQARQCILDLDHYDDIIFISVNAVEYGMAMIDNYWPQLPVRQSYWAIGKATKDALAQHGIQACGGDGAMNSESLLAHADLQSLSHRKFAIVRGIGGRETLADTLRTRGARVDYIECYQRQAPAGSNAERLNAIAAANINCSVVNSGESLHNLTSWLPSNHRLFQCPIITPGERVAALAAKLGYARTVAAENASLDATLSALLAARSAALSL